MRLPLLIPDCRSEELLSRRFQRKRIRYTERVQCAPIVLSRCLSYIYYWPGNKQCLSNINVARPMQSSILFIGIVTTSLNPGVALISLKNDYLFLSRDFRFGRESIVKIGKK